MVSDCCLGEGFTTFYPPCLSISVKQTRSFVTIMLFGFCLSTLLGEPIYDEKLNVVPTVKWLLLISALQCHLNESVSNGDKL